MKKYLNTKEYYEDLYDKFTVEDCLNHEKFFLEKKIDPDNKDAKEKERIWNATLGVSMYFKKGLRYKEKESTIREWMNRDQETDRRLEEAILNNVECPYCYSNNMELESKDLYKEQILFLYKCNKCKKRSAFNEKGEQQIFESMCPKCNTVYNHRDERKNNKIISYHDCPNCGHKEEVVIDLNDTPKEDDIWKKYRSKYCLSEEEGRAFIDAGVKLENMKNTVEKMKAMEINKDFYNKLDKLEKLNIAKLKELLNKSLIKNKYIHLEFSEPEIKKDIIVGFKIQDDDTKREEYKSKDELKKTINATLENTNWKLMSDGINYRLGFLSGRLRGYENEDDLIKLVK